jgi:hypothetical protein
MRPSSTVLDFSRVIALLRYWSLQGATRAQIFLLTNPPEGCSCKRELDGADGFTFEEFGVGSDTEGF